MFFNNIKTLDDIHSIYNEYHLININDKINFLKILMNIKEPIDKNYNQKELIGLENLTLKYLSKKN